MMTMAVTYPMVVNDDNGSDIHNDNNENGRDIPNYNNENGSDIPNDNQ